jgi:hypothetical protein
MLFTDLDPGSFVLGGGIAAIGAAIVAILKVLLPYLKERSRQMESTRAKSESSQQKIRREAYAEAKEALGEVIRRQDDHMERQDAVIKEQHDALEAMAGKYRDCYEECTELRSSLRIFYDALRRQYNVLKQLGHDPGDMPEIPNSLVCRERDDVEFKARQALQSGSLTQQAAKVVGDHGTPSAVKPPPNVP